MCVGGNVYDSGGPCEQLEVPEARHRSLPKVLPT